MRYVKITKLNVTEDAKVLSSKPEDWKYGQANELSPPVGYTLEGYLVFELEIGKPIMVDRRIRDGVRARGSFVSSNVQSIDGNIAKTRNSEYLIETQFIQET